MRHIGITALCILALSACHSRTEQNKSSVTVQLPPPHTGNTADNVGEQGETENNE